MTETLRWGILGNATIARRCVIPAIQNSRNGTVQALASRFPENAQKIVDDHRIGKLFDSYETLLNDDTIDAVYIPLPNHLHHPWTLKALAAGKHVLCEKPLAGNAIQTREMAGAAADEGLLLMEAFMYRFHPRSQKIKQMIADDTIGPVRLMRSAFCFHTAPEILQSGNDYRLKPEASGGALLDVGCYGVSVARWLMGQEPTHLQAQAIYHSQGVDVQMIGTLRFADDALAVIEASFISALQQTFTVVGSRAVIELPHNAFIPFEKEAVFTLRERDEEDGQIYTLPGADEYQLMVEHFADSVLTGKPLLWPVEDSIANLIVLDGLAQAAKTGQTVRL